jgi:predicted lipopolysaccharide heptosyltransferase III
MITEGQRPNTKDQELIDWKSVRRVLVVRLRSIGDTVLATPSLIALRRSLPNARIDLLLEDWVKPLVDDLDTVSNVIAVPQSFLGRIKTAWQIRRNHYDVVFNLHGGTTSTLLTRVSGAKHRVGYSHYQYSFLYNRRLTSSADFWKSETTHSAEQQLALLGSVGISVDDRPKTSLTVSESAKQSLAAKFSSSGKYALIHPSSMFHTKQWPVAGFAAIVDHLAERGVESVAVASKSERHVLELLQRSTRSPLTIFDDLTLPEITALASGAAIFVGNDSGIAHIAAAVNTPSVVIFGSSNRNHWRPWTDAPNEIVFNEFHCQPCPGYECKEFGDARCIASVTVDSVAAAVDRVVRL